MIRIELDGDLALFDQEGGFCSDDITIDGKPLDLAIAEAIGHKPSDRGGACVNGKVGRCRLVLEIER